jgi:hypothetical protein
MSWQKLLGSYSISLALSSSLAVVAHDLEAKYVPWGIEEYELIGLSKEELTKRFKGKLFFDREFTHAWFQENTSRGPQFLLTFSKGTTSSIQRLFIDGGGCHIIGPILNNKAEAMKFVINGLSAANGRLTKAEQAKLSALKHDLQLIEKTTAHN